MLPASRGRPRVFSLITARQRYGGKQASYFTADDKNFISEREHVTFVTYH